jgi:hypothetical protein
MKHSFSRSCDHCRLPIERVEEEWLGWVITDERRPTGLPVRKFESLA